MGAGYNLRQIPPNDIEYNQSNPRGEEEEEILSDSEFELLKASVYQYGVLVPIVVHKQEGRPKPYRLVDGERRLRAAQLTNQERIPAHVATGDNPLDDLVKAFHIHMLRKQWKPIATARALKKIKQALDATGSVADETELLEELQNRTGCSESKLKALRRAIRFPDPVLDAVANDELLFSHLVQIEESVVEHLDAFPDVLKAFSKAKVRHVLVEKAKRGVLTGTRDLMDHVAPILSRAKTDDEKNKAVEILKQFFTDGDMRPQAVLTQYEHLFPTSGASMVEVGKAIAATADSLAQQLGAVSATLAQSYPDLGRDLRRSLQTLKNEVAKALRRLGRE